MIKIWYKVHSTTAWRVPWVADGGVGLQIWRIAANILNKQSWTADQEWSSSLGVWREAKQPHAEKITLAQKQHTGPRNSIALI